MKLVKRLLGAFLGAVAATVMCWGLLFLYGAFILHGQGSLFDTNPNAANAFFATWGGISILFALLGAAAATHVRRS
jgi:hypothetical protein